MIPSRAAVAPTGRQLRKHIAWLNTLSPEAPITLAAMHFRLAAMKRESASVVLAVDPSWSTPKSSGTSL